MDKIVHWHHTFTYLNGSICVDYLNQAMLLS